MGVYSIHSNIVYPHTNTSETVLANSLTANYYCLGSFQTFVEGRLIPTTTLLSYLSVFDGLADTPAIIRKLHKNKSTDYYV